ncbi:exodeoxyribonuclease I subunit D [Oceanihabitans sediminis]|uniref:Nuclease SbcCD subunit D n=1 Tax=Oceanihabitans sediminis TaxID=1812012 RepID=A0A368P251_9FLAO|nr:exonuclease subunit SbcD [Oceanihabitans sediminis]RBP28410.1 exodeoxyribonuclease I subunit D [Oceanihabitans sediminis]RCU56608.1 exonuclease subunit SbcD [Oceanihabitans sediminis]
MKILHTSDWHIGKQLHKTDLSQDIDLFFDWLLTTIKEQNIDLLLVSGDVFDQANPSQASLKQYYSFLKRMLATDCKLLITGGNHDSASVLNAPKDILSVLDVDVVGGAPEAISDLFFSYTKEEETVVVAAVPFLKDRDIRKSVAGESYSDKIAQIKGGLEAYYAEVNNYYKEHFSNTFFIVMGHLYVQGAHVSESMRDIQIGNQAGVSSAIFGDAPHYVALGHIHKPYPVSASKHIYYSGSPVALSFSEKEETKQVNIITTDGRSMELSILPIPKFRNLVTFQGTFKEVSSQLKTYKHKTPLKSLAEIIVVEADENIQTRQDLDALVADFNQEHLEIVKTKLIFTNKVRGASEGFQPGISVADVTPMEMFEKKLEMDGSQEDTEALKNAFRQILEELNL